VAPESIQRGSGTKVRGMGGSLGMIRISSIAFYGRRGEWEMWRMFVRGEGGVRVIQIHGLRRLVGGVCPARKGDLDIGICRLGSCVVRFSRELEVW